MKVIGITGGIGSGKSEILAYLQKHTNCRVIIADQLAHELEEPGGACYGPLTELLGRDVLAQDGAIDRKKMAAAIFVDQKLLERVNDIVHPAVKAQLMKEIAHERQTERYDYLFLEAALLIEEGYGQVVDEMWYIHADESTRRKRLKASRGYSDEKIDSILRRQLPEETFYEHCRVVIENSGRLADAYRQIDEKLGEESCQKQ